MVRVSWKIPVVTKSFLVKNLQFLTLENIYLRSYVIPSNLVGEDVYIHNGQFFQQLHVRDQHVGYKFGEFSTTKFYKKKSIKEKGKRSRKK